LDLTWSPDGKRRGDGWGEKIPVNIYGKSYLLDSAGLKVPCTA